MPAPLDERTTTFGQHVWAHRRALGLTQEALAERAGVSPRSISALERGGAHAPRRDTVALLARALNLVGQQRSAFEALVRRPPPPRSASSGAPRARQAALPDVVAQRHAHNVPRALTSFIGRERELGHLAEIRSSAPILTLLGTGGVGKTRLAQEVLRTHASAYSDGGWLVELAGLTDAAFVPTAVATAVSLAGVQLHCVVDALAAFLRGKHLLLVLDNCEHLVDACAEFVSRLMRACPRLHVLVTSREPLGIAGEVAWRLAPLDVPDLRPALAPEQISQVAAVRLFIDRARAVNHTLVLTPDTLAAIARICIAVDGVPLALELAATRTRHLSVQQIADRLEHDTGVLGEIKRAGLPHHQSIRAATDWSHSLLGQQERTLLRRLSVFASGWTLDLAEAVCCGGGIERGAILDLLTQLVDKSVAVADTRETVARYRLLEPIRQYALERLEAAGEASAYRARHATELLERHARAAAPHDAWRSQVRHWPAPDPRSCLEQQAEA